MNEYGFLLGIATVLFLGAMSPGPSFLVVAQNSLNKSRAHGIATAIGTGFGVSIFAVLAGFGVTALFKSMPIAFLIFKVLGGAYLIYLAYKIWSSATQPLMSDGVLKDNKDSLLQAFYQGLIAQTSNPKTALVIAGIFAAFMPVQPPPFTLALIALIAFIIDFSWYAFVALSLSVATLKKGYARAKVWLDRVVACLLALIGLRLIIL